MAKTFKCADAGNECSWSATAESEDELMKKVAEHAKTAHPGMEVTPELVEKIKSQIKDI